MTDEKKRFYGHLMDYFDEWTEKSTDDDIQGEIATAYSELTGAPANSQDADNFVFFVGGFHAGVDMALMMTNRKRG